MSASTSSVPVRSGAHQDVRIRPVARWRGLGLGELWQFRELLYFLSKRELQVRYKQSIFGLGWAVAQPLALAAIFSLVFGHLIKVPSEGVPYPVFAVAGFTAWLFISQVVINGGLSLVADANLLTKVYFPRMILPLAKAAALLVDTLVGLVVVVVVAAAYGVWPDVQILTLPLWILLMLVPAIGLGLYSGALNVRYRDVAAVLPLAVQIWLFLTPVTYPPSVVPAGIWRDLYAINPEASAIEGLRWALLGTDAPSLGHIAISVASSLIITTVAVLYFRRSEQTFADVV
jgi:lipopolysaccharide transport system permease protein